MFLADIWHSNGYYCRLAMTENLETSKIWRQYCEYWGLILWLYHRSITPKFVTPTALSCIDNSWRSTTLSPSKKLTSATANLEWCHVHFIRDPYSTFIRHVIGPSKNSMEFFFNAKFDFKSTWIRDWATSHHKHPVCQRPAGDVEKSTNVWSRYLERIGLLTTGTGVLG